MLNYFSTLSVFTLLASLLLFVAARPISKLLNPDNIAARVNMMRVLNFLIILAILAQGFLWHENAWLTKITQSLIIIYFAVILTQIVNFFVRKRFGKKHQSNNQTTISDTYASRGLSLFIATIFAIIALISCLKVFELNSLLETGGVLGIIGLFLALTQAAWAPDIISGLIILNSRLCEEGDVIQFNMDGNNIIATVFKTKLFHTECLDLANNHRIMVRNARLRDYGIQNLSRFASAKGLRECLLFNIDYKHNQAEVTQMIDKAFEKIIAAEEVHEEQHAHEIRVFDTGDYAVTWAVYYYIKDVKKTLSTRQLFRAYILAESDIANISLSTPVLQTNYKGD